MISLASSQCLRWIDEINGVVDADVTAKDIKQQIKRLRSEANSKQNTHEIKRLYSALDDVQFKKDYICLIIDRKSDYIRACKGFTINGVRYVRLLGTVGGIKNSTIVFVSEAVAPELRRRIDNGRDLSKAFMPAKLEAYKSLVCSASTPVSSPHGVLVVDDLETTFEEVAVNLSNDGNGEPKMSEPTLQQITITASDGCGMMLPRLAERWSQELGLGYVMSGCCTRAAFEKGMVFTFPFDEFASDVAGKFIVKDAWGHEKDIREIELILPVSMLKLWDSYDSIEDYLSKSEENGYTFAVTKVCVEQLESCRTTNYQFLQVFDLDDDDINELIAPTVQYLRDIMGGDWAKTVLYTNGKGLNAHSFEAMDNDWCKAIIADRRMLDDPFIQNRLYSLTSNRIDEAKVGVLNVHGNYSMACGDLYALCQHIFGMDVTGLLHAGQIYNGYWAASDSEEVLAFRAPMSCAENVCKICVSKDELVKHWFRYMNACTVFNAWDSCMCALNGMDFDGDLVMLTDNPVLLRRYKKLPTLMCAQRKADKIVPTDEDFIKANIASFGNEVGAVTNRVTSMYEVRSHFDKNSDEYKELNYRIRSGQQLQQDVIDKAKGIISEPMPRSWYDYHDIYNGVEESKRSFYKSIIADKKPYFMKYIYPPLARKYRQYIESADKNSIRQYGMSVSEMLEVPIGELSDEQREFIRYFDMKMPLGTGSCVMNEVCRKIETEFSGYISKHKESHEFDYNIMKSGVEYPMSRMVALKKVINEYSDRLKTVMRTTNVEKVDTCDRSKQVDYLIEDCEQACVEACTDKKMMCDILLDIAYTTEKMKGVVWKICGDVILSNLIENNGGEYTMPVCDEQGDFQYLDDTFEIRTYFKGEDE